MVERTRKRGMVAPWLALPALVLAGACGGGGASLPTGAEGSAGGGGQLPDTTSGPPPAASALFDTPEKYFVPTEVTVAVGGTVTWRASDNSHEILFDGNAPPGGDIPFLKEGHSATRTFPVPGTYRFWCDRHDDVGVVFVGSGDGPGDDDPPTGGAATVSTPGVTFSPALVTIDAGETVTWRITGTRHNVAFRGAAPEGGDIPDTEAGGSVSRTFTTPGTYDYDCTRHQGMTGRVVVQ